MRVDLDTVWVVWPPRSTFASPCELRNIFWGLGCSIRMPFNCSQAGVEQMRYLRFLN